MWVWLIATLVRNVCVHVELKKLYAAKTAKQYFRNIAAPMVSTTIHETPVEELSGSSQQPQLSDVDNPLGGTSRVMFLFHVVNLPHGSN
jgi:hypothetical protein